MHAWCHGMENMCVLHLPGHACWIKEGMLGLADQLFLLVQEHVSRYNGWKCPCRLAWMSFTIPSTVWFCSAAHFEHMGFLCTKSGWLTALAISYYDFAPLAYRTTGPGRVRSQQQCDGGQPAGKTTINSSKDEDFVTAAIFHWGQPKLSNGQKWSTIFLANHLIITFNSRLHLLSQNPTP